jgi:glutamate racemase
MTMLRHAAPDLVYAAETMMRGEMPDAQVFRDAVAGLIKQSGGDKLDTMVLGCTHFPLVESELRAAAKALGHPQEIRFVDGSDGIARRIAHLTDGQSWPPQTLPGIFVTTGPIADIEPYHPQLAEYGLTQFASL